VGVSSLGKGIAGHFHRAGKQRLETAGDDHADERLGDLAVADDVLVETLGDFAGGWCFRAAQAESSAPAAPLIESTMRAVDVGGWT
jgi:hypothetical protein